MARTLPQDHPDLKESWADVVENLGWKQFKNDVISGVCYNK